MQIANKSIKTQRISSKSQELSLKSICHIWNFHIYNLDLNTLPYRQTNKSLRSSINSLTTFTIWFINISIMKGLRRPLIHKETNHQDNIISVLKGLMTLSNKMVKEVDLVMIKMGIKMTDLLFDCFFVFLSRQFLQEFNTIFSFDIQQKFFYFFYNITLFKNNKINLPIQ